MPRFEIERQAAGVVIFIGAVVTASALAPYALPALMLYPVPTILSVAAAVAAVGALSEGRLNLSLLLDALRRFLLPDRRNFLADWEGDEQGSEDA